MDTQCGPEGRHIQGKPENHILSIWMEPENTHSLNMNGTAIFWGCCFSLWIFAHHSIILRIFSHLVKGELVAFHVDKKRLIRVEDGAGRVPVQCVDRLACTSAQRKMEEEEKTKKRTRIPWPWKRGGVGRRRAQQGRFVFRHFYP